MFSRHKVQWTKLLALLLRQEKVACSWAQRSVREEGDDGGTRENGNARVR